MIHSYFQKIFRGSRTHVKRFMWTQCLFAHFFLLLLFLLFLIILVCLSKKFGHYFCYSCLSLSGGDDDDYLLECFNVNMLTIYVQCIVHRQWITLGKEFWFFFFVRYRPVKLFQNINNKLALDTLDKKNETKIDRSAGPGQMKVDIPRMSKNNWNAFIVWCLEYLSLPIAIIWMSL